MELQAGEIAPSNQSKVNKLEPAQKTWFFERPDGSTFAAHANEAFQILKNKHSNVAYRDLKFIGCSSGEKFREAVKSAQDLFRKTRDLAQAQEMIRQGELDELESARGNKELPPNPERFEIKLQ